MYLSGDSRIQYARTCFGTNTHEIRVHDTGARYKCTDPLPQLAYLRSILVSFFDITSNLMTIIDKYTT